MSDVSLDEILAYTAAQGASDLHITADAVPHIRVDGELLVTDFPRLTPEQTEAMAHDIMPPRKAEEFERISEADFGYEIDGVSRFRVNVYRQRERVSIVFRTILAVIPSVADLGLPPVIEHLAATPRGLILVTGPAGTGKTTTIAAMVGVINRTRRAHVVMMEDPIEVLHHNEMSIIDQREVGVDTVSFGEGMRHVLRQDPDVIVIGEIRDRTSMLNCIQAAETGHLVISTLHTIDATETVNRVIDLFPPEQQREARVSFAAALAGIVSQRLVRRADGNGRVPTVEVLLNTGRVQDLILDPEGSMKIREVIHEGDYYGMQTFQQSLVDLVQRGVISAEDAQVVSTDPHDLALALQGSQSRG